MRHSVRHDNRGFVYSADADADGRRDMYVLGRRVLFGIRQTANSPHILQGRRKQIESGPAIFPIIMYTTHSNAPKGRCI